MRPCSSWAGGGEGSLGESCYFRLYTLIKVYLYFECWMNCLRVGGGVARWKLGKREAGGPYVGEGS